MLVYFLGFLVIFDSGLENLSDKISEVVSLCNSPIIRGNLIVHEHMLTEVVLLLAIHCFSDYRSLSTNFLAAIHQHFLTHRKQL